MVVADGALEEDALCIVRVAAACTGVEGFPVVFWSDYVKHHGLTGRRGVRCEALATFVEE